MKLTQNLLRYVVSGVKGVENSACNTREFICYCNIFALRGSMVFQNKVLTAVVALNKEAVAR